MAPTQDELDRLPAEKRLELINQKQQNRHQRFNTIGILLGVVITALSLIATAFTVYTAQGELRATQEELRITQEGQITDRYSTAVAQLGAGHGPVRIGGIYALERIARESQQSQRAFDRGIIIDVLASFVLSRDPAPGRPASSAPARDVYIALSVVTHLQRDPSGNTPLDLRGVRTPNAPLRRANLAGADLAGADLFHADLSNANLTGANLTCADLTREDVKDADLTCANLAGANLRNANLTGANLRNADLTGADLTGARLCRADVRGIRGARVTDNIEARTRC